MAQRHPWTAALEFYTDSPPPMMEGWHKGVAGHVDGWHNVRRVYDRHHPPTCRARQRDRPRKKIGGRSMMSMGLRGFPCAASSRQARPNDFLNVPERVRGWHCTGALRAPLAITHHQRPQLYDHPMQSDFYDCMHAAVVLFAQNLGPRAANSCAAGTRLEGASP